MHHASLSGFPTLILAGTIHSVDTRSRPSARGSAQSPSLGQGLATSSSSSSRSLQNIVYQLQLLIRMKNYATDLCVRVNVPMKEIAQDEGEVAAEVTHAKELLGRVVASLDVRDFGLFGAAA